MPGITATQLNNIKITITELAEVTDALFISGGHDCLILDIDATLGNDINYYSDLIKRFRIKSQRKRKLILSIISSKRIG